MWCPAQPKPSTAAASGSRGGSSPPVHMDHSDRLAACQFPCLVSHALLHRSLACRQVHRARHDESIHRARSPQRNPRCALVLLVAVCHAVHEGTTRRSHESSGFPLCNVSDKTLTGGCTTHDLTYDVHASLLRTQLSAVQ